MGYQPVHFIQERERERKRKEKKDLESGVKVASVRCPLYPGEMLNV